MSKFRTIDRMETMLLRDGFEPDTLGNAVRILGKFPPEKYCDVRGYVSRTINCPRYVVLAEVTTGMKEVWKHGSMFEVPAGSVEAFYETHGTHLEGFFSRNEEPLEDDARRLGRYLFKFV